MAAPLVSRLRHLIVILMILLSAIGYRLSTAFSNTAQKIRVLILRDAPSFNLTTKGPYRIVDYAGRETLSSGVGVNTAVTAYRSGIMLAGSNFNVGRLRFLPEDEVAIDGRRFKGSWH